MIGKTAFYKLVLVATLLFSPAAFCDSITITLDNLSSSAVVPGGTVSFAGTLTGGASDLWLNGASFTSLTSGITGDDSPFLFNSNFWYLAAGTDVYGTLFDVSLDPSAAPGTYSGYFNILGGDTELQSMEVLGTAEFSVTVPKVQAVPEPATAMLLASGVVVLARMRKKLS